MRRRLDALPLIRAARALRGSRERGALALYAALAIGAGLALVTPASRALQSELVAAHHFRPTSLPAWILLQLLPKMYSFAHTCWIGDEPLAARTDPEAKLAREGFWVNHYPARRARFDAGRAGLERGRPIFLHVRTRYRGLVESTTFVVYTAPGRLVIRRGEAAP